MLFDNTMPYLCHNLLKSSTTASNMKNSSRSFPWSFSIKNVCQSCHEFYLVIFTLSLYFHQCAISARRMPEYLRFFPLSQFRNIWGTIKLRQLLGIVQRTRDWMHPSKLKMPHLFKNHKMMSTTMLSSVNFSLFRLKIKKFSILPRMTV